MVEYISVGLICTAVGALIAILTFNRNKSKDDKTEGQQVGVICTELGYVKAGIDDIKSEMKEQRRINVETSERLAKVEASAKQAHLRIDRMEGREYPSREHHGEHE